MPIITPPQNTPVLPNMRRTETGPSGASISRRNSTKLSLATMCAFPHRSRRAALPSAPHAGKRSGFDEGQQVGVDDVGVRGAHAVRQLLVDLERAFLEKLRRKRGRVRDRHDLVV